MIKAASLHVVSDQGLAHAFLCHPFSVHTDLPNTQTLKHPDWRVESTSVFNPATTSFRIMLNQISDLITAANVGIMLFFSVAVAPTVFMVLPAEWSAAFVRKFFPRYFLFLGITSAIAAALHKLPLVQTILGLCALVFFFSVFWLTPRINLARDNKATQTFNRLHFTSVGLNLLQLAVMIWLLIESVLAASAR